MSSSVHESLYADPVEGCVVEFLDKEGISCAAYVCGKCAVIAARGADGLTYTADGECENLLFDVPDRTYDEPMDAPSDHEDLFA